MDKKLDIQRFATLPDLGTYNVRDYYEKEYENGIFTNQVAGYIFILDFQSLTEPVLESDFENTISRYRLLNYDYSSGFATVLYRTYGAEENWSFDINIGTDDLLNVFLSTPGHYDWMENYDEYSYTTNYYLNSSSAAWGEISWTLKSNGKYSLDSVPNISQSTVEEYFGTNAEIKSWNFNNNNYTNEELLQLEFTPEEAFSTIPYSITPNIGEKTPVISNTAINGIRLNGQQPLSVYIGSQEIIKIIYNGRVIYNKGDGLPGHTYADLAAMTHEQLSQYTHAELAGGNTTVPIYIGGVRYETEPDMTWGEWCDSEYNIDNFIIDVRYDSMGACIYKGSDNIIIEGLRYRDGSLTQIENENKLGEIKVYQQTSYNLISGPTPP